MRKLLFFWASVIVLAPALSAQDVITLKNGDEIQVKVTKVGDNEIEYKKWSNPNGPTYTKAVSEIFMIKYENGEKEVYNQTNNNQQQQNQVSQTNQGQGGFYQERIGSDRMRRDGRDLKIGSHELTEDEVRQIFSNEGLSIYKSSRNKIATGNAMWPIGLVIWIAGDAFSVAAFISDEDLLFAGIPLFCVGGGLFVTGLVMKSVGKGRLNGLADEYNSGRTNTLSLSVQPTLMRTYDKSYAPGVGIALRF